MESPVCRRTLPSNKVGPDQYKKNYVYLNAYTLYIVEDITGTHTDPYHYKLYLHSLDAVSVDVKP